MRCWRNGACSSGYGAPADFMLEGGSPGRRVGAAFSISELVPGADRPVSNDRHHKKIAGAGCRDVSKPHRFRPVTSQFLVGSFEFGWRAAAERL